MNCIKNDSRVLIKKIYTSKILHLAFKMFEQKKTRYKFIYCKITHIYWYKTKVVKI